MLLKTGRIGLRGRQMGGRSPRTMMCLALFVGCAGWLVTTAEARQDTAAERPPVQVYILAGQSNMEGKGSVVTVEKQLNDPERRDRFAHLKDGDSWAQRDDVWIHYLGNQGRRSGPLTIGYGVSKPDDTRLFGPELGFGWTVGDAIDAPVLIIKTAWGGKSIDRDFRPPSRGFPPSLEEVYERAKRNRPDLTLDEYKQGYGHYYRLMVEEVHRVLDDIGAVMPEYDGQGYELAGFVWFQGWNDQYAPTSVEDYQDNLAALIRDVRQEFAVPSLPVVIGAMGHNGAQQKGKIKQIADAQAAVAQMPEFQGTVKTVRTAEYRSGGGVSEILGRRKKPRRREVARIRKRSRLSLLRFTGFLLQRRCRVWQGDAGIARHRTHGRRPAIGSSGGPDPWGRGWNRGPGQ